MLHQEGGTALGLHQAANKIDHARNEVVLDAGRWLVEQENAGAGGDRPQQRDELLLTERQLAGRPLRRAVERDGLQQAAGVIAVGALLRARARQKQAADPLPALVRHRDQNVLERGQERKDAHVLEAAAQSVPHRVERPHAGEPHAVHIDVAGLWREYAADDVDDRGLAGAVGASTRSPCRRNFDRDILEYEDAAEIHRQPVDVKAAIPGSHIHPSSRVAGRS